MSSTWTPRDSPVNNYGEAGAGFGFVCAIKDGTDEAVAAGWDDGDLVWVIYTTDGGVTWNVASDYKLDAQGSQPEEAYYSSLFNRYYISGYTDEEGATLISSTDGDLWDIVLQQAVLTENYQGIVDAPSLGITAAVGRGNTTTSFYKTSNGTTWTRHDSTLKAYPMRDLAWSEDLGLFAACQQFRTGTSPKLVWTSPDGITWTGRTTPVSDAAFFNTQTVAWMPIAQCFLLGAKDASSVAHTLRSTDGINWTDVHDVYPQSFLELSDERILADNGSGYSISSDGGLNWINVDWTEDKIVTVNMMDSDEAFGEILVAGYMYRTKPPRIVGRQLVPQMVATGTLPREASFGVSFDDVVLPQ